VYSAVTIYTPLIAACKIVYNAVTICTFLITASTLDYTTAIVKSLTTACALIYNIVIGTFLTAACTFIYPTVIRTFHTAACTLIYTAVTRTSSNAACKLIYTVVTNGTSLTAACTPVYTTAVTVKHGDIKAATAPGLILTTDSTTEVFATVTFVIHVSYIYITVIKTPSVSILDCLVGYVSAVVIYFRNIHLCLDDVTYNTVTLSNYTVGTTSRSTFRTIFCAAADAR